MNKIKSSKLTLNDSTIPRQTRSEEMRKEIQTARTADTIASFV
jgi:hypothetical protein